MGNRETMNKWKTNLESILLLVKDEDHLSTIPSRDLTMIYNMT